MNNTNSTNNNFQPDQMKTPQNLVSADFGNENLGMQAEDVRPLGNLQVNNIQNEILIVNTDDKISALAGESLEATRTNRMIAWLGQKIETISVLIQAYNRLEKTKTCVECVLKYTTDIDYELILFDNGSTDGTLDYFKSVKHPRKRIIRVTKNLGSAAPFIWNQWSGRYLAYIMGDVYVTKNWLTNLLACLKSEERIGMVSPVASNVSLQGADITFNTFDEMQEKAAKHNNANPDLWNERLTLFPAVGVYKREALELCGLPDTGFFHYLGDNDLTFRLRRAGYKLMLCKDTFVHHDHDRSNSTEKDPEEAKRSMEAGRRDFKRKFFGIEAWEDVNNFEPAMISLVNPQERRGSKMNEILGVDVLCGTPILEVKNKLREDHVFDARLSAFSTNAKYWLDLKTICAGDVIVDRIEHIQEHFPNNQFDYIVLGLPINGYQKPLRLLQDLLKCLNPNGHLLIKLRNTFDITSCFKTLGANIQVSSSAAPVYQLSLDELIEQINNAGYFYKNISTENWPLDEKGLQFLRNAIAATGFNQNPDQVFVHAVAQNFVIDITGSKEETKK